MRSPLPLDSPYGHIYDNLYKQISLELKEKMDRQDKEYQEQQNKLWIEVQTKIKQGELKMQGSTTKETLETAATTSLTELELLKMLANTCQVLCQAEAANRVKPTELGRILIAQIRSTLRALPEKNEALKEVEKLTETKVSV